LVVVGGGGIPMTPTSTIISGVLSVHSLRVQACHTPPMGRATFLASCVLFLPPLGMSWPAVASTWQSVRVTWSTRSGSSVALPVPEAVIAISGPSVTLTWYGLG
jgi:hypothetical protein